MGLPILDPLSDLPPAALTERTAKAPPNQLATFRFPADRQQQDARRWFPDGPQARPVRTGNEVMYLIDGAKAFAAMANAASAATDPSKHFIYILGWTMFLDFPFAEDGKTLAQVLEATSNRGVQIRVMIWDSSPVLDPVKLAYEHWMPDAGHNSSVVDRLNDLRTANAVLDSRTLVAGAHHQKVFIVNGAEGLVAFCGGIDANPDRVFKKGVQGSAQDGAPMHDVHCRIRGAATFDVLETFIQRWTDFHRVHQIPEKGPLFGKNVTLSSLPKQGRLHVQIGRTFGNGTAHAMLTPSDPTPPLTKTPYEFAVNGESTNRAMFLRAIAAARRFIYIEDQYLVNPEASAALVKALPNISHLTILIPHSDISDMPRVHELRKMFVAPLRSAGGDKVRIFVKSPFGPDVPHSYVHAKTWVFDDQFAIIGSANTNQRGWTHDSEICAGIYDESTNDHASYSFAHRLRVALWAEHLNMNTPAGHAQLADGVASAANWLLPGGNVEAFAENAGQDKGIKSLVPLRFIDPDGA